jgi:hypothetical protein
MATRKIVVSKKSGQYSDKEAKRRATDALRRALTTPYKPQGDMVGKVGRNAATSKRDVKKRK